VQKADAVLFWKWHYDALQQQEKGMCLCNRYCKFALGEVLYMFKGVMPKIPEEEKRKEFEKRVQLMGAVTLLFIYSHADRKKLDGWSKGNAGFKYQMQEVEAVINVDKLIEVRELMVSGEAWACGSMRAEGYAVRAQIGPHFGKKMITLASEVRKIELPFLGSVESVVSCVLDVCREKYAYWRQNFPSSSQQGHNNGHPEASVALVDLSTKSRPILDPQIAVDRAEMCCRLNCAIRDEMVNFRVELLQSGTAFKKQKHADKASSEDEGDENDKGKGSRKRSRERESEDDEEEQGGERARNKKKKEGRKSRVRLVEIAQGRWSDDNDESSKAFIAIIRDVQKSDPNNRLFSPVSSVLDGQIVGLAQDIVLRVQHKDFQNEYPVDPDLILGSTFVHAAAAWNAARLKGEDKVSFTKKLLTS
jgi:hypothetical protein